MPPELKLLWAVGVPMGNSWPKWRSDPIKQAADDREWVQHAFSFDVKANSYWLKAWPNGIRPGQMAWLIGLDEPGSVETGPVLDQNLDPRLRSLALRPSPYSPPTAPLHPPDDGGPYGPDTLVPKRANLFVENHCPPSDDGTGANRLNHVVDRPSGRPALRWRPHRRRHHGLYPTRSLRG